MPYADNRGIRIHYEVEGEGPPLVLYHGLGWSQRLWRIAGWTERLKDDYQLILMDARGHGFSDKPHDPRAYKMATRVTDVVAILDDLGIDQAHFLGYSMGGEVGWGIASLAPERFRSLILGGLSLYGSTPEGLDLLTLFQQGMEASLAAGEALFGPRWTLESHGHVLGQRHAGAGRPTLSARGPGHRGPPADDLPAMPAVRWGERPLVRRRGALRRAHAECNLRRAAWPAPH